MPNKLYKILLILFIIFVLVFILLFFVLARKEKKLEVSFLDVGQGDSILIETPMGENILIDGGPNSRVIKRLSEELPFWDRKIDLMILTHPHDDHVVGLIDVLKRYDVKKILYTGVSHNSPAYLSWLKEVEKENAFVVIIDKPQVINLGVECTLNILYPFNSFLNMEVSDLNNTSIVSQLDCGGSKILLAGDAEEEVEKELLDAEVDIDADIFKASHHGSNTSNSEEFLKKVSPKQVIISVGENNKFNHPSLRVLYRLERLGAQILRTDIFGTIHAEVGPLL